MRYLGVYTLKIENGRVRFPWENPADESKIWLVSEGEVDGIKTTGYVIIDSDEAEKYISERDAYEENFKIQSQGEFVLGTDNIWEIPEIILNHLKTDDIIFNGVNTFVEIMSLEDMENYKMLLGNLEEALKKAAIEEGVYDEYTK